MLPAAPMPTPPKRKPGRPRTYIFDKPDELLTENEQRQKIAVEKRRMRQNRSYQRKKASRKAAQEAKKAAERQAQEMKAAELRARDFTTQGYGLNQTIETIATSAPTSFLDPVLPINLPEVPVHQRWANDFAKPALAVPVYDSKQNISPLSVSSTTDSVRMSDGDAVVPLSTPSMDLQTKSDTSMHSKPGSFESFGDDLANNFMVTSLTSSDNPGDSDLMEQEEEIVTETLNIFGEGIPENVALQFSQQPPFAATILPIMCQRFAALDPASQAAVMDMTIFPESFNEKAACAVVNRSDMYHVLKQLVAVKFVEPLDSSRYQLNTVAKSFLTTCNEPLFQSSIPFSLVADKNSIELRFMKYFTTVLASLEEDQNIHQFGAARERAMEEFDKERANMMYTQHLSREDSKAALNSFLTAASSVLRFCVSARQRAYFYLDALDIDANSSDAFSVKPELTESTNTVSSNSMEELAEFGLQPEEHKLPENTVCPKMKVKATLQLGLAEAYYDMRDLWRTRVPLDEVQQTLGTTTRLSCIPEIREKTLSLLLSANLSMTEGRIQHAKKCLIHALKTLNEGGLSKSTYGVGAILSLIGVYSASQEFDKARKMADELLEVLIQLGFDRMPIYADCMGSRAAVSLAMEDYVGAEGGFVKAIEVLRDWKQKEWSEIPVQHCLDLDLWLLGGLKRSLLAQGKHREGYIVSETIRESLKERGITDQDHAPVYDWDRWYLNMRHLY